MKKIYFPDKIETVREQFKLITFETAFLIRTFFFVVFGMTIDVLGLFHTRVIILGTLILILTYFVRFINLKLLYHSKSVFPEVLMAPRGLITVLLYFKIPEPYRLPEFKEIISFVVLGSAILMMIGLMVSGRKTSEEEFQFMEDADRGNYLEDLGLLEKWKHQTSESYPEE